MKCSPKLRFDFITDIILCLRIEFQCSHLAYSNTIWLLDIFKCEQTLIWQWHQLCSPVYWGGLRGDAGGRGSQVKATRGAGVTGEGYEGSGGHRWRLWGEQGSRMKVTRGAGSQVKVMRGGGHREGHEGTMGHRWRSQGEWGSQVEVMRGAGVNDEGHKGSRVTGEGHEGSGDHRWRSWGEQGSMVKVTRGAGSQVKVTRGPGVTGEGHEAWHY